jgi:hypothetical protein
MQQGSKGFIAAEGIVSRYLRHRDMRAALKLRSRLFAPADGPSRLSSRRDGRRPYTFATYQEREA